MNDMPDSMLKARVEELLAFFELEERADEHVGALAKG